MKKINFELRELIRSDKATKLGINNEPTTISIYQNLFNLIVYLLQPIRNGYGKPMIISSGYRCTELNNAVGGVANSFHTVGLAADINNGSRNNEELFKWISKHRNELPINELILGKNASYVHVSLSTKKLSVMLNQ